MKKEDFRKWLSENTSGSKKYIADLASRVKTLENNLRIDMDKEYKKDSCESLLNMMSNKGLNIPERKRGNIPVNTRQFYNYRNAMHKYIAFKKATNKE